MAQASALECRRLRGVTKLVDVSSSKVPRSNRRLGRKGTVSAGNVHHSSLQGIRLLDLTGEGANELVIESDSGGAGTAGSDLLVFDLSKGRLDEVLNTESRMQYLTDDWYTQTLDLSRTRESHGQQFCFSKTTLFEAGKAFRPPRVTRPCYKRGDGVDSAEVRDRNKMLTPPRGHQSDFHCCVPESGSLVRAWRIGDAHQRIIVADRYIRNG